MPNRSGGSGKEKGKKMKNRFTTTAAYVSGCICGNMWIPNDQAGKLIKKDLRGYSGIWQKGFSFDYALDSLLMREGGDFQNAKFTADSVIRIERIKWDGKVKTVHVWEREISALVPELVNADSFTSDFLGEE